MSNTTQAIYEGLVNHFKLTEARIEGDVLQTPEGFVVRGRHGFHVYQWPESTRTAVTAFLAGAVVGLKAIRTRPNGR
jgi:hypothetical protein